MTIRSRIMMGKNDEDDLYELSPLTLLLIASMLTAVVVSVALKFIYSVEKNQTKNRFKKRTREEEEKILAALPAEEQIEADAESSEEDLEEEEKVPENVRSRKSSARGGQDIFARPRTQGTDITSA